MLTRRGAVIIVGLVALSCAQSRRRVHVPLGSEGIRPSRLAALPPVAVQVLVGAESDRVGEAVDAGGLELRLRADLDVCEVAVMPLTDGPLPLLNATVVIRGVRKELLYSLRLELFEAARLPRQRSEDLPLDVVTWCAERFGSLPLMSSKALNRELAKELAAAAGTFCNEYRGTRDR